MVTKQTRTRAAILIALAVALTLGATGCGSKSTSGTSAPAGGTTIVEQDFAFSPSSVTVKVGDIVTFTNKDSATHRVKIDNQDLGQQANGQSVTWTATKAGTYPFSCQIHPSMTGQITVQ